MTRGHSSTPFGAGAYVTDEAPADLVIQKLRNIITEKARHARARRDGPEEYRLQEMLELSDEALVDTLFSHVEPNPDRVGCPPRDVLLELAHRTRPLTDPWWDHIMGCSPCRIDVREWGRNRPVHANPLETRPRRPRWRIMGIALLAIVGLILAIIWWAQNMSRP